MEIEVLAIEINEQPIELYKLLKIANLVGGGGEAKMLIADGYVFVNGETEYQKRKKIYVDDIVQFNGEAIMPVLNPDYRPHEQQANKPASSTSHNRGSAKQATNNKSASPKDSRQGQKTSAKKKPKGNSDKSKASNKNDEQATPNKRTGRRSISF